MLSILGNEDGLNSEYFIKDKKSFYHLYFYSATFSSSVVNMKSGDIGSTLEAL